MFSRNREKALLLDWGIGGLSVYKEIQRLRPELEIVYISDSGFTPYGKVPAPALAARVAEVIAWGRRHHGVSRAVIACNAASTVLSEVQALCPGFPVAGVIEAGLALVRESGSRTVGVIGGLRTIESRIFSTGLRADHIQVLEQVAQPLSALIERGVLSGPELESTLHPILAPLREVDALLLACTHYPAVAPEVKKLLPQARLLDPARRAAEQLISSLPAQGKREHPDLFFTSGSLEGSEAAAFAAFAVKAEFRAWP